jgi:hypothetical protein
MDLLTMRGLILSLVFLTPAAFAQGVGTAWFSNSGWISTNSAPLPPYSAEQTSEQVQTLADGTHITQGIQKILLYRDSAGRTRTEHTFAPPPGAPATIRVPTMIQIMDPVAGYMYHLNSQDHTAQRIAWPPAGRQVTGKSSGAITFRSGALAATLPASAPAVSTSAAPVPAAPSNPLRPQIQRESLGADTMEGLTVTGTRITTTYPEGSVGNDRPITVVTETWMSQDLKMPVLSKTSDPRTGETTTKLTNVSLAEPDPSLFQVPADYAINDQQQQQ